MWRRRHALHQQLAVEVLPVAVQRTCLQPQQVLPAGTQHMWMLAESHGSRLPADAQAPVPPAVVQWTRCNGQRHASCCILRRYVGGLLPAASACRSMVHSCCSCSALVLYVQLHVCCGQAMNVCKPAVSSFAATTLRVWRCMNARCTTHSWVSIAHTCKVPTSVPTVHPQAALPGQQCAAVTACHQP
jgi:hypothetical protein